MSIYKKIRLDEERVIVNSQATRSGFVVSHSGVSSEKIVDDTKSRKPYFDIKPFIKWVGGKRQLLPALIPCIPQKYNRYIEPFLGGGALFFYLYQQERLNQSPAILSDVNRELMSTYQAIAKSPESVIRLLRRYPRHSAFYYTLRQKAVFALNPVQLAARMIYLNRNGFNGSYRVNSRGKFNVPFGGDSQIRQAYPLSAMRLAAVALRKQKLLCEDYKTILRRYAKSGDFIFLDPPYYPITKHCNSQYTPIPFGEKQHEELANEVKQLTKKGCQMVLTNSNCPAVHQLYANYNRKIIRLHRCINVYGHQDHVIVTAGS